MLVMTKKRNSNFTDSVDNQNAGPPMNFLSVFTHDFDRCFVTSGVCYRLMVVVVKAKHTTYMHNILLESLLSDVLMCLNGSEL